MERILIIDDELETCELLKDILEEEGYSVSFAVSGQEGLNIIEHRKPDLIICDVVMESLNGIGVISEIKSRNLQIPIIMTSAYGVHDKVVEALELGASDFIAKPFRPKNLVDTVKKTLQITKASEKEKEKLTKGELSPMRRLIRDSYMSILKSLAVILESKDPYIREHSMRVTKYAKMLAEEMGLKPEEIEVIENTAQFHDIGKIGVSDNILQKPAELTAEEWEHIKRHPQIGYDIVEPLKVLHVALPGIRHHHERYDGQGYPDRLKGDEIPISGRILAIADAYEALTATRPYRKAKTAEESVIELRNCAGTQFDPKLVEIFINSLKKAGEI